MEVRSFRIILILISFMAVSITSVFGQESPADYWLEKGNDSLRNGQIEEADNFFDRALGVDPSYAKAWILKGDSLRLQGRHSDSLEAYEKAIEFSQSKKSAAEAWSGKGVALDNLGKYGEAIKAYNKAIELDPKWATPWNNLGDAFRYLGDYNKSIDAYNKAIELDPYRTPIAEKNVFLKVLGMNAKAEKDLAKKGYKLAIQSVDIDGNKAYMELIKDGSAIDSKVIVAPNKVDDTFAYTKPGTSQAINVHFKNIFRGADSNLATIDRISQTSERDPSRMLINDTHESIITSGTPLKLEDGYELAIKSVDIDGNKAHLELTKDGSAVDSKVIIAANEVDDTFVYSKPGTSQTIKVHFKNGFRGADQYLVTADNILQTSDIDPSRILINDSFSRTFTAGTPLKLDEGYEVAVESVDIDGNKVYIKLFKDGSVVDSKVIVASKEVDDKYIYSKPGAPPEITMHFKNTFRGADSNLVTVDDVRQTSELDPSQILVDDPLPWTIAKGAPLELEEGYELAVKSVDIDGNKVYIELLKDGVVVDSRVIIAANEVDDTFVYSRPGSSQAIKVHIKNAFRGADRNLVTIDNLWQSSEIDPSHVLANDPSHLTVAPGTTLKLAEGYKLAIKSVDIDGNRVHMELIKNGRVLESGIIVAANDVDDTFVYTKPGTLQAIKVHFKNAFRGVDRNFATIDRLSQTSEINPSRILIDNNHESTIALGTVLELEEGYDLVIKAIDIDGNKAYVELLKDGDVVGSKVILAANKADDTYVYSKPGTPEAIKVHFKNAFRGSNQNLVTIDDIA